MNNSIKNKINIGIIGGGFISQQCHLPSFFNANCNIIGIAEPNKYVRESVCKQYNIPNQYSNHTELLENKKINAVVVVLKREYSYYVIQQCLKAKKHVLAEKPLAFNWENVQKLFDLAKSNNVLLQVGHMKRHDQGIKHLKKIIENNFKNNKKIISINIKCFMGDSYCNPSKIYKSNSIITKSYNKIEKLPNFDQDKFEILYERYLNVFGHSFDLIHYLLNNNEISLRDVVLDNKAQGIVMMKVLDIPISFSTAQSNLKKWVEEIEFLYEDSIINTKIPPALLKNIPAKTTIFSGKNNIIKNEYTPDWSWSFFNQAKDFLENIRRNKIDNNLDTSSQKYTKLIKKIIKKMERA